MALKAVVVDDEQLAREEFYARRCPLTVMRTVKTTSAHTYVELWPVRLMILPDLPSRY